MGTLPVGVLLRSCSGGELRVQFEMRDGGMGELMSDGVRRSAYVSNLFSLRNRFLVMNDWFKVKLFGRYVNISLHQNGRELTFSGLRSDTSRE